LAAPREPHNRPTRVSIPVRSTEAGERGHQVDATVVGDLARKRLYLLGSPNQAEPIAQPLYDGARNENAALERIFGPVPDPPRYRRHQVVFGRHGIFAGVHQHEAPGAVRVLDHPGARADLPEERGLLVARDSGDGHIRGKCVSGRPTVEFARRSHLRQHAPGDVQQIQELIIPLVRVDVVEKCTRGVRYIRHVEPAARHFPDEPRIDCPEGQLALLGPFARALHVIQDPLNLGTGEVSIDHELGFLPDEVLMARISEAITVARRSSVLPHDGIVDGFARSAIPDERRLTLIGDADARYVVYRHARPRNRLRRYGGLRRPDLARIMFHPAGPREDLLKLELRHGKDLPGMIEEDGARARGALVKGEDTSAVVH